MQTLKLVPRASGNRRPFQAVAYREPRLNTIVILTQDCSYTECPISNEISLLENNHPNKNEDYRIGILIYGAKDFCAWHGIPTGNVRLSRLFAAAMISVPDQQTAIEQLAQHFPKDAMLQF